MDAESGELFASDGGCAAGDSWTLDATFSQLLFRNSETPMQDWAGNPECTLSDSGSEDHLHTVDPNEVFPSVPSADPSSSSSESDGGVSEEPAVQDVSAAAPAPPTVYQVVYDLSGLKAEQQTVDVISIELDEWSSNLLLSDSCIVSELPLIPAVGAPALPTGPDLMCPDLQLTEEEQKLLNQEGVSLPSNLPLTKAEERILKKVRRKIRNKQSAQDSRRRRKEYIDSLESRAAACSAQNKELQRTVEQLEKHNMSLLTQLRRLQSLIKQTVSKGAQTSTCLLIILVSLGLIILPSFSPFRRDATLDDDYRPIGVISRNILTDLAGAPGDVDSPVGISNSWSPPSELSQSGLPDGPAEPPLEPEDPGMAPLVRSQSGNSSDAVGGQTKPQALGVPVSSGRGGVDAAKPAHADEM